MPATLDITLALAEGTTVYPARFHGAACALFGHPEPGGSPDFSTWPLVGADGVARWRVGWMSARPCRREVRSVLFGDTVHSVLGLTVAETTYAQLAAGAPARRADIEVVSPLYFSRGDRDHPLPDPYLVIQSLADRWDRHAGALALPEEVRRALLAAIYLVAMDGRTETAHVGAAMLQTGFVGGFTLGLTRKADEPVALAFQALIRFAEVAGIGAQTGHGFGAVRTHLYRPRTDQLRRPRSRLGARKRVPAGQ